MSIIRKFRSYFFDNTGNPGSRFRKNDHPTQTTFESFLDSIGFLKEKEDTSTTSTQGFTKLSSDASAQNRDSTIDADFFAKSVRPHQLPNVIAGPSGHIIVTPQNNSTGRTGGTGKDFLVETDLYNYGQAPSFGIFPGSIGVLPGIYAADRSFVLPGIENLYKFDGTGTGYTAGIPSTGNLDYVIVESIKTTQDGKYITIFNGSSVLTGKVIVFSFDQSPTAGCKTLRWSYTTSVTILKLYALFPGNSITFIEENGQWVMVSPTSQELDHRYTVETNISTIQTQITVLQTTSVPTGLISMWSGSIAAIPTGWLLCNGTLGTPDLTSRFVVGASIAGAPVIGGAAPYTVGSTGGSDSVTLDIAAMPAHDHGGFTNNNTANHDHTIEGAAGSAGAVSGFQTTAAGLIADNRISFSQNQNHNHVINSQGGGGAHENRPTYYAIAFIMKS